MHAQGPGISEPLDRGYNPRLTLTGIFNFHEKDEGTWLTWDQIYNQKLLQIQIAHRLTLNFFSYTPAATSSPLIKRFGQTSSPLLSSPVNLW